MAKKNDEFDLINLPVECQDESISKDDFKLVASDTKIFDKKFNTKPTTFFKDCVRRFSKNKSSVVAAWILGILLLMSIVVPAIGSLDSIHSAEDYNTEIKFLEPKLFSKGDFWSGRRTYTDIDVDTNNKPNSTFVESAIVEGTLKLTGEKYMNFATELGYGGYAKISAYNCDVNDDIYIAPYTNIAKFDFTNSLKISNFVVLNEEDLANSTETIKTLPDNYQSAEVKLELRFDYNHKTERIDITNYATSFNIDEQNAIDVQAIFNDTVYSDGAGKVVENPKLMITVKPVDNKLVCSLVESLKVETNVADPLLKSKIESFSFTSGNDLMNRSAKDKKGNEVTGYWVNYGDSGKSDFESYLTKARTASFVYDTYEAALGTTLLKIEGDEILKYKKDGTLLFEPHKTNSGGNWHADPATFKCEILDPSCPVAEAFSAEDCEYDATGKLTYVTCKVHKYAYYYNLDKMPSFLLGTDQSGRDLFVQTFRGLRTSLLLGVATTIVCFLFGLVWGSICGYFGGAVDLIMERFTDILSGVPWIVVMTLVILKAGTSNFLVFGLALCMTGWIGTAGTTRTQFYRFRGREYVLASRTLGASHGRLIAKHILPNAMGTIITSAVLMVPSVIFSEATLSYLGLAKVGDSDNVGLKSLGVILSDNEKWLRQYPYLIIFPSIIIALIMISFNLFGNGLRDAVNPSLKGEGE